MFLHTSAQGILGEGLGGEPSAGSARQQAVPGRWRAEGVVPEVGDWWPTRASTLL